MTAAVLHRVGHWWRRLLHWRRVHRDLLAGLGMAVAILAVVAIFMTQCYGLIGPPG